jgi:hypothetical protein
MHEKLKSSQSETADIDCETADTEQADSPEQEVEGPVRAREIGGRKGPDPTRFGDWEKDGRCIDF